MRCSGPGRRGDSRVKEEVTLRPPTLITTPMPTVEEIAALKGIPPERVRELVALAERLTRETEASRKASRTGLKKNAGKGTGKGAVGKRSR